MIRRGWLNTGRLRRKTANALPIPYSRTGDAHVSVHAPWSYVDAERGGSKRCAEATSSQVQLDAGEHPEGLAKAPTHNDYPSFIHSRTGIVPYYRTLESESQTPVGSNSS
jgi:hypothetical protein